MHAKPVSCFSYRADPTNLSVFTATNTAQSMYFERLVGVYSAFLVPSSSPRASIMSIVGPVWAPNCLLDTTDMRFQHPSKTLNMLRCPTVRNEGPIVLMMLARKKCPKPSVEGGHFKASKNHPKLTLIFDTKSTDPGLPRRGGSAERAAPP